MSIKIFSLSALGRGGVSSSTYLAALFAAFFFAVHPIQTESVTYISGRSSSLITLFF
jgi:hypothetical protein